MDATTTTETTEECDHCSTELSEAQYEAGNGLCDACHALHATCSECDETTLKTDMHPVRKGLCESCGDSAIEAEYSAALDAAGDELQALVDELTGAEDLVVIRKAIAALKRLAQ
jgi:hypothetical protein